MPNKNILIITVLVIASASLMLFKRPGDAGSKSESTTSVVAQALQSEKMSSQIISTPLRSNALPTVELVSHPCTVPQLEGVSHNEHQIRDDILEYIDNVTTNNERARKAAIKFAYYENQSYYHSLNAEEAIAWDRKSSLAGWCLVIAEPEKWDQINKNIAKLMNNTADRQKYIHHVDETFFGGRILGSGMTEAEETEKCRSGDY